MGRILAVLVFVSSVFVAGAAPAGATSCTPGDPTDSNPDTVAIQACIDSLTSGGTVYLTPGSPGYILDNSLNLTNSNVTITTNAAHDPNATYGCGSSCATLVARGGTVDHPEYALATRMITRSGTVEGDTL